MCIRYCVLGILLVGLIILLIFLISYYCFRWGNRFGVFYVWVFFIVLFKDIVIRKLVGFLLVGRGFFLLVLFFRGRRAFGNFLWFFSWVVSVFYFFGKIVMFLVDMWVIRGVSRFFFSLKGVYFFFKCLYSVDGIVF